MYDAIGLYPEVENKNIVLPAEFLAWAKTDIRHSTDQRSRGNAISNIKKAIHAKLDELISKTHVRFTNDWPTYPTTAIKLYVIKRLGIEYHEIVQPITDIRDEYEHQYLVPPIDTVRQFRSVAEMWLKHVEASHEFDEVALGQLPLTTFNTGKPRRKNGSCVSKVEFKNTSRKVFFFYNSKKKVLELEPNGDETARPYSSISFKDMLTLERKFIRAQFSGSSCAVNEKSCLDIYRQYKRWLTT